MVDLHTCLFGGGSIGQYIAILAPLLLAMLLFMTSLVLGLAAAAIILGFRFSHRLCPHARSRYQLLRSCCFGALAVGCLLVSRVCFSISASNLMHFDPFVSVEESWVCQPGALEVGNEIASGHWRHVFSARGSHGEALVVKRVRSTRDDSELHPFERLIAAYDQIKEGIYTRAVTASDIMLNGAPSKFVVSLKGLCAESAVYEKLPLSLENLLSQEQQLTWPMKLRLAADAARGLVAVHSSTIGTIIHSDVKLDQFMLDQADVHNATMKIGDFNRARVKTWAGQCQVTIPRRYISETHRTYELNQRTSTVPAHDQATAKGRWRSPEEYRGVAFDEKADIYSLGLVLYCIALHVTDPYGYGGQPVDDSHYSAVGTEGLRPPIPEALDRKFAQLLSDCWHQDPDKRPSAKSILSRLESMI